MPLALAVAAGAKTFFEVVEYAADLPVCLVVELGVCSWSGTPSGWTFARVLAGVDHGELDQALSGWMLQGSEPAEAVAVDGETMRAAVTGREEMPQTQVVAAMTSRSEVVGQAAGQRRPPWVRISS
ncbi:transposase family protein [Saccharopolyspora elongata]|uniref:transposase family protein n=1 Tax=Saccharopolyspora elongata TaxID=2530387 RepID=UPI0014053DD6|nr:transposase family protein [Saccharopolyspora elongata]